MRSTYENSTTTLALLVASSDAVRCVLRRLRVIPSPAVVTAMDQLFLGACRCHPSRARSELGNNEGGSDGEVPAGKQQPLPPLIKCRYYYLNEREVNPVKTELSGCSCRVARIGASALEL